jgi:hypothetical protein
MLVTYIRPNGTELRVNDTSETRAVAEQLGWKLKSKRKTRTKRKAS